MIKFSVLLSVYRNEKPEYLNQAIRSIWDDQLLKPNEIVLVKDGSLTVELEDEIHALTDKLACVIKIVDIEENVGLAAALNKGLEHCSHGYVARMDTDDISLPQRFTRQLSFLEAHPEVDVCSAQIEEFDQETGSSSVRRLPLTHKELKDFARYRNPISHPVSIFKKEAVKSLGGYPLFRKSQDYGLWSKMMHHGCVFANIDEVLLRMRTGAGLLTRRSKEYLGYELRLLQFQRKIGFIDFRTFLISAAIRSFVRLSPAGLKRVFYEHARG